MVSSEWEGEVLYVCYSPVVHAGGSHLPWLRCASGNSRKTVYLDQGQQLQRRTGWALFPLLPLAHEIRGHAVNG